MMYSQWSLFIIVASIEQEEKRADSLFNRLLRLDSKNPRILRSYATFQEYIKFNKFGVNVSHSLFPLVVALLVPGVLLSHCEKLNFSVYGCWLGNI